MILSCLISFAQHSFVISTNMNSYVYSQASLVAQLVKNPPATQETLVQFLCQEDPLNKGQAIHCSIPGLPLWLQCGRPVFDPWVGKIPWRTEWLPTPGFLLAEFHGLFSPWGVKSQTRLSYFHLSYQHINLFLIVIHIL